ncbi:TPA: CRTAC1 family protein, partial [Candidatus Poribacteria bacterium]|nr:CRTAC1 family protein [Candidatus Poribacteria bacterium]
MLETLGSGATFFDYDNDNDVDLYVVNGADLPGYISPILPTNILYRNNGNGTFTDVTKIAGVGNTQYGVGCAAADYDNDGDVDLYVTNYGPNVLYRNNGDGTFTDVTQAANVGENRWSTSCAFLDYDNDSHLDLLIINYMKFSVKENSWWEIKGVRTYRSPADQIAGSIFVSEPDTLYRNNGNGTFTDVTQTAGILLSGLGLSVAVGDYDNDGDADIQIANDMERDFLYQNNGDGTFTEIAAFAGVGYDENGMPGSGMGSSFGDYDNDGDLDLIVSNASAMPAILYRNEGGNFFSDVSFSIGIGPVTLPYFKWAIEFIDQDNDGFLDIFIANGHLQENIGLFSDESYPQQDLLFWNRQGKKYVDISVRSGLGRMSNKVSRGTVFSDYDNDGDIDIFINNSNQSANLLRNKNGNKNNWITIKVLGTQSNRSGIGTRIKVTVDNLSQTKEVRSGSSYLSQNDLRLLFGLGGYKKVDHIEVRWPSGLKQKFLDIEANQILTITEGVPAES